MPWTKTLLDHPRHLWLRRALFQVHLWTGLGLGLYVLVISVSGAALVFAQELGRYAQAELRRVAVSEVEGRVRLTLTHAAAAVGAALPGSTMISLSPPETSDGTFMAGVLVNRKYKTAFVHPVTGHVTGPVEAGGAVLGWVRELHANLFAGRTGRVLNGVGGGFLFLLCLTGLAIWWPGRRGWRRAIAVDPRAGWKRMNFDLHSAAGFWFLLPVAVLAVTGSYFTWPQQFRAAISLVSPVTRSVPAKSDPTRKTATPPSLDTIAGEARRHEPSRRLVRIAIPNRPDQTYTVFFASGESQAPRAMTQYFFDRHSGELLRVKRGSEARTFGDVAVEWLGPLHTGNFGGVGIKVVWSALGLAPALLFGTGFLLWWNRVVAHRWRTHHVAAHQTAAPPAPG